MTGRKRKKDQWPKEKQDNERENRIKVLKFRFKNSTRVKTGRKKCSLCFFFNRLSVHFFSDPLENWVMFRCVAIFSARNDFLLTLLGYYEQKFLYRKVNRPSSDHVAPPKLSTMGYW